MPWTMPTEVDVLAQSSAYERNKNFKFTMFIFICELLSLGTDSCVHRQGRMQTKMDFGGLWTWEDLFWALGIAKFGDGSF